MLERVKWAKEEPQRQWEEEARKAAEAKCVRKEVEAKKVLGSDLGG